MPVMLEIPGFYKINEDIIQQLGTDHSYVSQKIREGRMTTRKSTAQFFKEQIDYGTWNALHGCS